MTSYHQRRAAFVLQHLVSLQLMCEMQAWTKKILVCRNQHVTSSSADLFVLSKEEGRDVRNVVMLLHSVLSSHFIHVQLGWDNCSQTLWLRALQDSYFLLVIKYRVLRFLLPRPLRTSASIEKKILQFWLFILDRFGFWIHLISLLGMNKSSLIL